MPAREVRLARHLHRGRDCVGNDRGGGGGHCFDDDRGGDCSDDDVFTEFVRKGGALQICKLF